jgi:alpha-beta hydrolase superfamily lysophospholipase
LHKVAGSGSSTRGAVVFVHGLGGDPRVTWRQGEGEAGFWPAWFGEDFPGLDIYTLEYAAHASAWQGQAMALPDRATNVLAELVAERLDERPLVFVCHSLGGLVVKQVLRIAADQPGTPMGRILDRTQGVVFLATPNAGSDLATWMDRLRVVLLPSAAAEDLKAHSPYLRDLNVWYREWAPREDIATLVFVESGRTHGAVVVDPTSGDPGIPGVRPIPLDADHLAIAKPSSRDDTLHKTIRRFLEERLPPPAAAPVLMVPGNGKRRIFISYRRRAAADAALAGYLHKELTRAGHEVFIDMRMKIGIDWSAEITRRIDWCEFLIVLLSENAVASEMVQEEVRLAHHRRKQDGTPVILPVRVRHDGELGYELGAYLTRLQYARWTGPADDRPVLEQLLEAILAGGQGALGAVSPCAADLAAPSPSGRSGDLTHARPPSVADPRVLRRRPDQPALPDDPFYLERDADRVILPLADDEGQTIVVKAPYKMGKTSLLVRYLARCRQKQKRIAFVDFKIFSEAELDDPGLVLTGIAAELTRELGIDPEAQRPIATPRHLTEFVEDVILARLPEPVTLALDEVDRLVTRSYHNSLFAMLRGWHNRRATHFQRGWDRLDLVLVVATEPNMLIQDTEQSPFNVTDPVRLEPFAQHQLDQLNTIFGSPLGKGELDELHELMGGQPYLTRLAFYRLGPAVEMPFWELARCAADDDGPFGEHLRAKLTQLQRRPALAGAMARLIRRGVPPDEGDYHRLHAAGLTRREGGRIIPANLLYARFLGRVLPA